VSRNWTSLIAICHKTAIPKNKRISQKKSQQTKIEVGKKDGKTGEIVTNGWEYWGIKVQS
jgi:hypothetical protein